MLLAAVLLITLHSPGGRAVYVNPQEVSSVRMPRDVNKEHFAKGTRCVLLMANSQIISVIESCQEVRDKLEGAPH